MEKIESLVSLLEGGETAEFMYDGFCYEIFESSNNDAYIVNVYSNNQKDEEGELMDKFIIDGGLCTGTAEDAIGFML